MILTPNEYAKKHIFIKNFIDEFCIYKIKPGEPPLVGKAPNTWYSWQFYLRRGLFNAEVLGAISEMFLQKVFDELPSFDFQIAGLETASTPLLAGIPLVAKKYGIDINAFSIRKNRKEYGLLNWIEGRVNNKPIMLIDDLCGSTMSLRKSYDTLIKVNLTTILNRAFVVVNKGNAVDKSQLTTDTFLPETIKVMYLYSMDDFMLKHNK